ncbi:MAG: TetR/AcrR family transcriptional regulator [Pseudomonadota bacterium]
MSMQTSKPKRTRDPESKRAALHAAALRQFTEKGYEHVSIASIAKEAGIAVGTVYRFYENKLFLLRAMLESIEHDFVQQMQEDWARGGAYEDRLDAVCQGLFDIAKDRSAYLKLFTMTTDLVYEDGALPGDRIQDQIKQMYQEGMEQGAFRNGDLHMMSSMAHGLVEGAMMRWMRMGHKATDIASKDLAGVMKYGFLTPG